jgi:hypothetical protein
MFVQIIIMATGNGSQAQPAELSSMSHGHVVESGFISKSAKDVFN